ncbi:MAG: hypothetical protein AAFQ68_11550 [Bacteroidota bacterium]
MMSDQQWIEAYLQGQLSADEQAQLEKRLAEEAEFDLAFREAAHLYAATKITAQTQLKSELAAALQSEEATIKPLARQKSVRWWYVAAAAIMLLALGYFLWPRQEVSPTDLFATYYEAPPTMSLRQADEQADWQQDFEKAEYALARQKLLDIREAGSAQSPSAVAFYLGITYLESEAYGLAIAEFEQVASSSLYYPQSLWYTALAQLKAENLAKAADLFRKIALDSSHYKQAEAKLLLETEVLTKF